MKQGWGYNIEPLESFLLVLFDKYAELLKRRFSEDFQEVRKHCSLRSAPSCTDLGGKDCLYR